MVGRARLAWKVQSSALTAIKLPLYYRPGGIPLEALAEVLEGKWSLAEGQESHCARAGRPCFPLCPGNAAGAFAHGITCGGALSNWKRKDCGW